jgi:hypothetical protein
MKKLSMFTVIKPNSTLSSGPVEQTGYTESAEVGGVGGPQTYRTRKSVVGSFRLDFIPLTEGIILDVCYEMWE